MKEITFETRDDFNRKPIADKVIRLLTSDIAVSPMVIDGSWGTGKTEFCHKLIALVNASESCPFLSVYVDAFKSDHAKQPLITLLAAVLAVLPESEYKTDLKQKALPLLRFGLKTASNAVLGWALQTNADALAEGVGEALKSAGEQVIEHSVAALLEDHINAEKNIQALREALEKIAADKPIVLFIDELDRCCPDFALAMLEIIKHVFDVERVKFVLVTNKEQLKASISHGYGSNVDAQRYLDKFLGFSLHLPSQFGASFKPKEVSVEHLRLAFERSSILSDSLFSHTYKNSVFNFLAELLVSHKRSLREVEALVKYLEVYHLLSDNLPNNIIEGFGLLRVFGVYLYCFENDLGQSFLRNNIDLQALIRVLDIKTNNPNALDFKSNMMGDVFAMIFINSTPKKSDFVDLTDDVKANWQKRFKYIFDNGFNRDIEFIQIVSDAIRVLSFLDVQ